MYSMLGALDWLTHSLHWCRSPVDGLEDERIVQHVLELMLQYPRTQFVFQACKLRDCVYVADAVSFVDVFVECGTF